MAETDLVPNFSFDNPVATVRHDERDDSVYDALLNVAILRSPY